MDDWSEDIESDDEVIKTNDTDEDDFEFNDHCDKSKLKDLNEKDEYGSKECKRGRKLTLPPGLSLTDSQKGLRNPLLVDLDNSEVRVKNNKKIDSWFGSEEMKVGLSNWCLVIMNL